MPGVSLLALAEHTRQREREQRPRFTRVISGPARARAVYGNASAPSTRGRPSHSPSLRRDWKHSRGSVSAAHPPGLRRVRAAVHTHLLGHTRDPERPEGTRGDEDPRCPVSTMQPCRPVSTSPSSHAKGRAQTPPLSVPRSQPGLLPPQHARTSGEDERPAGSAV